MHNNIEFKSIPLAKQSRRRVSNGQFHFGTRLLDADTRSEFERVCTFGFFLVRNRSRLKRKKKKKKQNRVRNGRTR